MELISQNWRSPIWNRCRKINAEVAFTMTTETTNIITSLLTPEQTMLVLPNGFQVQVIDSIGDIVASSTKYSQENPLRGFNSAGASH